MASSPLRPCHVAGCAIPLSLLLASLLLPLLQPTSAAPRFPSCRVIPGCRLCPRGGGAVGGLLRCIRCRLGYQLTGVRSCSVCPLGSFCTGRNSSSPCRLGFTTTSPGRWKPQQCNKCKPGFAGRNCTQCQPGSWSAGGVATNSTVCVPCRAGYTSRPGAWDSHQCRAKFCPPGTGGKNCVLCRVGTWSPGGNTKFTRCRRCPSGTSSPRGATAKRQCTRTSPPEVPVPTSFLYVGTPVLTVGSNELLKFKAVFAAPVPEGSRVSLYESNSTGSLDVVIVEMAETPGSNRTIFTTTYSKIFTSPGDFFYAAAIDSNASTIVVVQITALAVPPQQTIDNRTAQMAELQSQLQNLTESTAAPEAVAAIVSALARQQDVRPQSVQSLPRAVFWDTVEGLPCAIYTTQPSEFAEEPNSTAQVALPATRRLLGLDLSTLDRTANSRPVLREMLAARGAVGLEQREGGGAEVGWRRRLAASPCATKGRALLLHPDSKTLGGLIPNTLQIRAILDAAGYSVTFKCGTASRSSPRCNSTGKWDGPVTIEDFKGWEKFALVYVFAHGFWVTNIDPYVWPPPAQLNLGTAEHSINTAIPFEDIQEEQLADAVARRIVLFDGRTGGNVSAALTAPFFSRYTGSMSDTVVIFAASAAAGTETPNERNMFGQLPLNDFARVFVHDKGASVFAGFDFTVTANKGAKIAKAAVQHLADGGSVEFANCSVCRETDGSQGNDPLYRLRPYPTAFKAYYQDPSRVLPTQCNLLSNFDVYIKYFWPPSQKDLDTGTQFLSDKVGYSCGNSQPYITWSGDDTSTGGSEIVQVNVAQAWQDGAWNVTTQIELSAGWYSPAAGSGQATLKVALINKETRELVNAIERSIDPGSQRGCADTRVGTVLVSIQGGNGTSSIQFSLIP